MKRKQLIKKIRTRLGKPNINVELSDEQIKECIDDGIDKFSKSGRDGDFENDNLFLRYTVSLCEILWGKILSKYSKELPGGGKVNSNLTYDRGVDERNRIEQSGF